MVTTDQDNLILCDRSKQDNEASARAAARRLRADRSARPVILIASRPAAELAAGARPYRGQGGVVRAESGLGPGAYLLVPRSQAATEISGHDHRLVT